MKPRAARIGLAIQIQLKPWIRAAVTFGMMLVGEASALSAQGLQSATNEEILAGARSCALATLPTGVDATKLVADGWVKATVSRAGKPVDSPVIYYGKGRLLVVVDRDPTKTICTVTARIESVRDFPSLQAAMASVYGAPIEDDGEGEQFFLAPEHRIFDLASTGSNERPAVRITVGPVFQEKK